MKKSWGLTKKIISGEKVIESRWYKAKYPPWDRVKKGDRIFFKDSGCPVTVQAEIKDVKQFENLNSQEVLSILKKYGKDDGIGAEKINDYYEQFKDKRYAILIFLTNVQKVAPFNVDKKGYRSMAAWICVEDINRMKIQNHKANNK